MGCTCKKTPCVCGFYSAEEGNRPMSETTTLRDYVQHTKECAKSWGHEEARYSHARDHSVTVQMRDCIDSRCRAWSRYDGNKASVVCTCGLDALLAAPRDSRAQAIEKKLSEVLLGMDHATGDRDLQIWIATEGIQEVLKMLRAEKAGSDEQ